MDRKQELLIIIQDLRIQLHNKHVDYRYHKVELFIGNYNAFTKLEKQLHDYILEYNNLK